MTNFDNDPSLKEEVILVDEFDNQVGKSSKLKAHTDALLHRAISVFIFNSHGEWLIQRRALHKYHSAGLWSNTCCSHPFPNESTENAALRRLNEEMGMTTDLAKAFHFIYKTPLENNLTEYELDHVFIGFSDNIPEINPDEACEYKFVSFEQLKSDVLTSSDNYTFWFKQIFERVNSALTAHHPLSKAS